MNAYIMKILIDRYYGDNRVTKSRFYVLRESGEIAFEGEAREASYSDYHEKFPGCMNYCVASGKNFRVDIGGTTYSPMTFKLVKIPGRLSCCITFDDTHEHIYKHINVGYADQQKPILTRKLKNIEKAKEVVTRLAYEAFALGETVTCDVTNENIILNQQELAS